MFYIYYNSNCYYIDCIIMYRLYYNYYINKGYNSKCGILGWKGSLEYFVFLIAITMSYEARLGIVGILEVELAICPIRLQIGRDKVQTDRMMK